MNFRDLVSWLPQLSDETNLSDVSERKEESLFRDYHHVIKRSKSKFPLEHLLNHLNAKDVASSLMANSERNFDRRSFVAKKSRNKFIQRNFCIYPCTKCIQNYHVHRFWLKQFIIKVIQHITPVIKVFLSVKKPF